MIIIFVSNFMITTIPFCARHKTPRVKLVIQYQRGCQHTPLCHSNYKYTHYN